MQSTLYLWILEHSLLLLTILTVKDVKGMQEFSKPVGGNMVFQCPVDNTMDLEFVYLQKGSEFVNGYHSSRPIDRIWNNTKRVNFTFYMDSLKLSDSGFYECIIMYRNVNYPVKCVYNLTVTVSYSKPSFTKECNNRNDVKSCQVTCMSQDGFPNEKIKIILAETGKDNNGILTSRNDSVFNLTTKLFSSTVTAEFNCSNQEVNFVCSVAGLTSDNISICTPPSDLSNIIIAITGAAVVLLVIVGTIICKKRRSCSTSAKSDNGLATNPQEVIILTPKPESKEEFGV